MKSNAERQREHRGNLVRYVTAIHRMMLELKEEIAVLRNEMAALATSLRNEGPALRNAEQAKSITSSTIAPPRRKGASIINSNWNLSLEDRRFAADLGLDPDRTAADFQDYWIAKTGADAVKADWSATWRRWCRKALEYSGPSKAPPPATNGHSPKINEFRAKQLAELARKGINVLPGSML